MTQPHTQCICVIAAKVKMAHISTPDTRNDTEWDAMWHTARKYIAHPLTRHLVPQRNNFVKGVFVVWKEDPKHISKSSHKPKLTIAGFVWVTSTPGRWSVLCLESLQSLEAIQAVSAMVKDWRAHCFFLPNSWLDELLTDFSGKSLKFTVLI